MYLDTRRDGGPGGHFGPQFHILIGKRPRPASFMQWARWFHLRNRLIKGSVIAPRVLVSSVFIGVPGELFETIVFVNSHANWHARTETAGQAIRAHHRAERYARRYTGRRASVAR